jgi:hypothetical protein
MLDYEIRKEKVKIRRIIRKIAEIKVRGESLKIDRAECNTPNFVLYNFDILFARGFIYLLKLIGKSRNNRILK